MPTKSQIPWLLAALVLVAYSHCVFVHGMEAGQRQELRTVETPLDNRGATCENESACICKGVTLAISVEAPAPELCLIHAVCSDSTAARLGYSADWQVLPEHDKTPRSGRMLRAQLQRFLL